MDNIVPTQQATLIFFCGKMASGKSTLSQQIAADTGAVLLSEDSWLSALYPNEIQTFEDYIQYASRLKPLLKQHVQQILKSGISVVMDFPANTLKQREWFKAIFSEINTSHTLIYLQASDQLCLKHIQQRRTSHPERHSFDTEEMFHQVNHFFHPPTEAEAFNLQVINQDLSA